jgi:tRNA-binding EMAP/Myf-like protein/uncharacterized membrane protein YtjA (UPF0391 family)
MNVSYEWLRAFVPVDMSAARLRDLITAHIATVDELVALRADLADIVIARVVEEAPHPDSDHLHVTKVDAGTGTLLDVVCGAANVTAGKLYPFAKSGTVLPGGLKLQKRKIRGAISDGMLCSARELALGEEQDGIDIFDPSQTQVLNPAAWKDPTPGTFSPSAYYYNDYRYQRHPKETLSVGRIFSIRERVKFQIRGEFTNAFNRTQVPNPIATGYTTGITKSASVNNTGFGIIASAFGEVAKIVFFVFIVLAVLTFLGGAFRKNTLT